MNESQTPLTDAIVRPYIDCKEINPEEVDALLSHAREQEKEIARLRAALETRETQLQYAIAGILTGGKDCPVCVVMNGDEFFAITHSNLPTSAAIKLPKLRPINPPNPCHSH